MASDPPRRRLDPVALVGYGRFGRAFADLLAQAGLDVRAWDPHAEIPGHLRTDTVERLVSGAAIVVMATPTGAFAEALAELSPLLDSDQIVMDVGSVKLRPSAEMGEILGARVPWVATHPLFGPTNIARGDRTLRAIVCLNHLHPDAVGVASRLYGSIGCDVVEQTPENHDRVMAHTHAMAFFIAKGLIDLGAGEGLAFTPPSFQALAQTIETVRTDAGHLFLAIQRDNPYAAPARKALLDALSLTHDQIGLAADDATDPTADPLRIPDLESEAPELMETRDLIDELDREILQLLARRGHLAERAGAIKAQRHRPVRDPVRERELLADRRRWAEEVGLPAETITEVFGAILRFSRGAQT